MTNDVIILASIAIAIIVVLLVIIGLMYTTIKSLKTDYAKAQAKSWDKFVEMRKELTDEANALREHGWNAKKEHKEVEKALLSRVHQAQHEGNQVERSLRQLEDYVLGHAYNMITSEQFFSLITHRYTFAAVPKSNNQVVEARKAYLKSELVAIEAERKHKARLIAQREADLAQAQAELAAF